jgi:hypothetical protein
MIPDVFYAISCMAAAWRLAESWSCQVDHYHKLRVVAQDQHYMLRLDQLKTS